MKNYKEESYDEEEGTVEMKRKASPKPKEVKKQPAKKEWLNQMNSRLNTDDKMKSKMLALLS